VTKKQYTLTCILIEKNVIVVGNTMSSVLTFSSQPELKAATTLQPWGSFTTPWVTSL